MINTIAELREEKLKVKKLVENACKEFTDKTGYYISVTAYVNRTITPPNSWQVIEVKVEL